MQTNENMKAKKHLTAAKRVRVYFVFIQSNAVL